MNFTIAKEQIMNGLQAVQSVVGNRTTLPILSNILLRASGNHLELTATDLDVTISTVVKAEAGQSGAITLPARKLFGIVRELEPGDVEFVVDDKNRCSLRSGQSFYKIHGLSADEFPPLPRFQDERKVTLERKKLKVMLERTSFAISNDEARYVLNGIFFSFKEHKLIMVATDGRRLAMCEEDVDVPAGTEGDFIVPTKAVSELNRLLGDAGEIDIQFSENQASFVLRSEKDSPIQIITKLIEGNYPNYRQVIPAEMKERVQLSREEFKHALTRAEVMTSDKQNSVKMTFARNNLAIVANTPDVGEGLESLAINYSGKEISIAFNPGYLIQPLKALEEHDTVFLELIDELSPGVLKINGPFLYVVMPMRLT